MGTDARGGQQPRLAPRHADPAFDRIARLVRRLLGVRTAVVAVHGPDGILLPGCHGVPDDLASSRLITHDTTLTRRVMVTNRPIVLSDVSMDPEIAAACTRYGAQEGAVAVMPVRDEDGRAMGALAAIHADRREWTDDELATLGDLAAVCSAEIQTRSQRERARQAEASARREHRRAQLLLTMSEAFAGATTPVEVEEAMRNVMLPESGASLVYLAVVDADRRGLTFVSGGPVDAPIDRRNPSVHPSPTPRRRLSDRLPVCDVVRSGQSMHFRSPQEMEDRYPLLAGRLPPTGTYALTPVLSRGVVIAVVCAYSPGEQDRDPDARALGVMLGPYVAHALERAALLEARREVATTLQAALLTAPPRVDGLEIATTYEPATRTDQVGGDWYDVVAVDDDTTVLMIGDVTGHDMQAAAWMGQLRSMLRALAWSHDESPSVLLTLLDRANHQLGPRAGATALVVRLERLPAVGGHGHEAGTYAMTWSNAGHLPPVVLRGDRSVEVLDTRTDLLLGYQPCSERTDHRTTLGPGETLVLYTDGLVERRGSTLGERISLLAQVLSRMGPATTASVAADLVRKLVPLPQSDDIAVLAVRPEKTPPGRVRGERRLDDSLAELGPARRWVDALLQSAGIGQHQRHTAVLLSSELLTNALEHGEAPVTTTVEADPATAFVRLGVRDASAAHPRMRDPEPHELSGRGVLFLDRLAARWGVTTHDGQERAGQHHQDVAGKTVWFELHGPAADV